MIYYTFQTKRKGFYFPAEVQKNWRIFTAQATVGPSFSSLRYTAWYETAPGNEWFHRLNAICIIESRSVA
jgi:hypothetical protein